MRAEFLAFSHWIAARWKWLICGFILAPFILWGAAWLAVASPWGKSFVSNKLEDRTGLKASIGSLGFIPFRKIWLNDVEFAPGAQVKRISIDIDWRSAFKGQLAVNQMTVLEPVLDLSVSELRELLPPPPADPSNESGKSANQNESSPTEKEPGKPSLADDQKSTDSEEEKKSDPKVESTPGREKSTPPPKLAPSKWLRVVNGGITLRRSPGSQALIEIRDANLEIPIDGTEGAGSLRAGQLKFLGKELGRALELPIINSASVWSINFELSPEKSQLPLETQARLQVAKISGLPFALNIVALHSLAIELEGLATEGQFSLFAGFSGLMRSPGTWYGLTRLTGENLKLSRGADTLAFFEEASASAALRAGKITTGVCRADGDQGAIIGLGELTSLGGTAMVRIVVAPSYRGQLNRCLEQLRAGWQSEELNTADRYFVDIPLCSINGQIGIMLTADEFLPLQQAKEILNSPDP